MAPASPSPDPPATVATESVADWCTLGSSLPIRSSTGSHNGTQFPGYRGAWQVSNAGLRCLTHPVPSYLPTLCILTILVPPFPSQAALQKKTESLPAHLAPVYRGHTLTRCRYSCPLACAVAVSALGFQRARDRPRRRQPTCSAAQHDLA